MREGLKGADVVMMLRLQKERMDGGFIPSEREYYHRYGLDAEKLAYAAPDAIVMHPGPMNRGVEIDGDLADDINRSVIQDQVEMGVAVRMACMDLLARNLRAERGPEDRGDDGVREAAKVVWQGAPEPWPAIKTWAAILAILLGVFVLLYFYMATVGRCVTMILEQDCIPQRRPRMEVVFVVLVLMAAGAFAVLVRTAMGFPLERYCVTETEIRSHTGWPLTATRVQPLRYASIRQNGHSLRFTGIGEKPVDFVHLSHGEADRLVALIDELKAAQDFGHGEPARLTEQTQLPLRPGETVLWEGAPVPGFHQRRLTFFLMLFGLPFLVIGVSLFLLQPPPLSAGRDRPGRRQCAGHHRLQPALRRLWRVLSPRPHHRGPVRSP